MFVVQSVHIFNLPVPPLGSGRPAFYLKGRAGALVWPAVLVVFLLLLSPAAGAAERPPLVDGRDFMSWRLLDQKRVSDGGTSVVLELLLPDNTRDIEHLEVFYTVNPWERQRRYRRVIGPAEIYTKELTAGPSAPRLDLYYGGPARLEIMAGALIDGLFHTARAMVSVYGEAGLRQDPDARPVSCLPVWPGLTIKRTGFYAAWTGEPIHFNIEADHRGQAEVRAFDRGREATAELDALGGGAYQYIPPLDPLLSAPGYSVKKEVVVVAALGDQGGVLSYYIPVHSSPYGHLYLAPGLLVAGLSALTGLGAVKLAGGRFKWR